MKLKLAPRYLLPALLLLLNTTACEESRKDVLSKEKMQAVLMDINVAEIYCTMTEDSTHPKGEKNPDSLGVYYKIIFDHHGITKAEFDKSLSWYKSHPDEMDTVVNRMMGVVEKWNTQ
jgi:hypothetical protein